MKTCDNSGGENGERGGEGRGDRGRREERRRRRRGGGEGIEKELGDGEREELKRK
jgi:hypothetical protein